MGPLQQVVAQGVSSRPSVKVLHHLVGAAVNLMADRIKRCDELAV